MSWEKWVLLGLLLMAACATAAGAGKRSEPASARVLGLLFDVGLALLVIHA